MFRGDFDKFNCALSVISSKLRSHFESNVTITVDSGTLSFKVPETEEAKKERLIKEAEALASGIMPTEGLIKEDGLVNTDFLWAIRNGVKDKKIDGRGFLLWLDEALNKKAFKKCTEVDLFQWTFADEVFLDELCRVADKYQNVKFTIPYGKQDLFKDKDDRSFTMKKGEGRDVYYLLARTENERVLWDWKYNKMGANRVVRLHELFGKGDSKTWNEEVILGRCDSIKTFILLLSERFALENKPCEIDFSKISDDPDYNEDAIKNPETFNGLNGTVWIPEGWAPQQETNGLIFDDTGEIKDGKGITFKKFSVRSCPSIRAIYEEIALGAKEPYTIIWKGKRLVWNSYALRLLTTISKNILNKEKVAEDYSQRFANECVDASVQSVDFSIVRREIGRLGIEILSKELLKRGILVLIT